MRSVLRLGRVFAVISIVYAMLAGKARDETL